MTTPLAATVEGSGPDILLIHGQPGSGADWAGVRRELRERYRVIVPDRPGYGETGGGAVGIADNATALAALLDELGSTEVIATGHSFGAGIALALAQRDGQRLSKLVLVCPVTPGDRLGVVDRVLATPRIGAVTARAGFAAAGWVLGATRVQRRVTRLLPGLDPAHLPEVARSWRNGSLWRSFYREQRALFDELPRLRDGLPQIAVPTTVVIGTHDRVTNPDAARTFASAVGARLVEVPHAGHMLPMQEPAEVAKTIAAA